MYRAAIFDLDGTLLDTLEDIGSSMNIVLARFGHPAHPLAAYRRFVGDGIVNLTRRALPPRCSADADVVDAAVAAMREVYAARYRERTQPYPGIAELLEQLTVRSVAMSVLSNKPHEMTRRMVRELLPRWRFERVEGARVGVAHKPDPTMAIDIAAGLGVDREQVVYVGDTDTDMLTANAAGMYAVGALWGFRDADELRAGGASMLAQDPSAVARLFD